jgi:hypothetical protein
MSNAVLAQRIFKAVQSLTNPQADEALIACNASVHD